MDFDKTLRKMLFRFLFVFFLVLASLALLFLYAALLFFFESPNYLLYLASFLLLIVSIMVLSRVPASQALKRLKLIDYFSVSSFLKEFYAGIFQRNTRVLKTAALRLFFFAMLVVHVALGALSVSTDPVFLWNAANPIKVYLMIPVAIQLVLTFSIGKEAKAGIADVLRHRKELKKSGLL